MYFPSALSGVALVQPSWILATGVHTMKERSFTHPTFIHQGLIQCTLIGSGFQTFSFITPGTQKWLCLCLTGNSSRTPHFRAIRWNGEKPSLKIKIDIL